MAKLCTLAFINCPKFDDECGEEAAKFMNGLVMGKQSDAQIVGHHGKLLSIVLLPSGEEDYQQSINAQLIAEGLASLKGGDSDAPDYVKEWNALEEEAKEG